MSHECRWAFPISLVVVESAAASARPLPQSVPRGANVCMRSDQIRSDDLDLYLEMIG